VKRQAEADARACEWPDVRCLYSYQADGQDGWRYVAFVIEGDECHLLRADEPDEWGDYYSLGISERSYLYPPAEMMIKRLMDALESAYKRLTPLV
jgi:hypothetical protein